MTDILDRAESLKAEGERHTVKCILMKSIDWEELDDIVQRKAAMFNKLLAEVKRLQSPPENQISLGVGDGSGNLFVYGSYEAIKAVREIMERCSRLEKAYFASETDRIMMHSVPREIPKFLPSITLEKAGRMARESLEKIKKGEEYDRL